MQEPAQKKNQTIAPKDRNQQIPRVPSRQSIKSVSTSKGRNKSIANNKSRAISNNKITTNNSFIPNKYED